MARQGWHGNASEIIGSNVLICARKFEAYFRVFPTYISYKAGSALYRLLGIHSGDRGEYDIIKIPIPFHSSMWYLVGKMIILTTTRRWLRSNETRAGIFDSRTTQWRIDSPSWLWLDKMCVRSYQWNWNRISWNCLFVPFPDRSWYNIGSDSCDGANSIQHDVQLTCTTMPLELMAHRDVNQTSETKYLSSKSQPTFQSSNSFQHTLVPPNSTITRTTAEIGCTFCVATKKIG